MADEVDRGALIFWMLYFVAVAASILVLGVVTVAWLARADTVAEKLVTMVLGTATASFIIWFYVIKPATAD